VKSWLTRGEKNVSWVSCLAGVLKKVKGLMRTFDVDSSGDFCSIVGSCFTALNKEGPGL